MLTGLIACGRRVLAAPISRRARNLWDALRDWVGVAAFTSSFVVRCRPLPKLLLYFGFAPGDDLLCTAVLRELCKRGRSDLMMVSKHRELFNGNDDLAHVRPLWRDADGATVSVCRRFVRIWGGEFKRPHYAPLEKGDQSRPPSRHIIAELCADVGITGHVEIRPYFTLTDPEREHATWARGHIVIQSSGMGGRHPIRNKQWPAERFQAVVDALRGEAECIQLGSITDPPLQHVRDLRGATSIRETASVLSEARLYVGTVGFLMHLARAVECPSVIIFGGREAPWQSGYICNFNLYTALPCAPCWRWNSCEFDRRCMSEISVADVVSAIRQMQNTPRGPLAVEAVNIMSGRPRNS
jgi:hypothetical protein